MEAIRTRIGPSGRLVIPAAQRKALGLRPGDELLIRLEDHELRITTLRQRIAHAQALARKYNKTGESMSESLIRDRRAEAKKD